MRKEELLKVSDLVIKVDHEDIYNSVVEFEEHPVNAETVKYILTHYADDVMDALEEMPLLMDKFRDEIIWKVFEKHYIYPEYSIVKTKEGEWV